MSGGEADSRAKSGNVVVVTGGSGFGGDVDGGPGGGADGGGGRRRMGQRLRRKISKLRRIMQ